MYKPSWGISWCFVSGVLSVFGHWIALENPIFHLSSIFHPSFIHLSSIFHPSFIHLSSIFHPSFIHLSSIFHPSFIPFQLLLAPFWSPSPVERLSSDARTTRASCSPSSLTSLGPLSGGPLRGCWAPTPPGQCQWAQMAYLFVYLNSRI